jgi:hypothetical protein
MKYGCRNENVGIKRLLPYGDLAARGVGSALALEAPTPIFHLHSYRTQQIPWPNEGAKSLDLDAPYSAEVPWVSALHLSGRPAQNLSDSPIGTKLLLRHFPPPESSASGIPELPCHGQSFPILKIVHLRTPQELPSPGLARFEELESTTEGAFTIVCVPWESVRLAKGREECIR